MLYNIISCFYIMNIYFCFFKLSTIFDIPLKNIYFIASFFGFFRNKDVKILFLYLIT